MVNSNRYKDEASRLSRASASMAASVAQLESNAGDLQAQLNLWQNNAKQMEHSIAKSADMSKPLWLRTLHDVRKEAALIMWRYGLTCGVYKTNQEKPHFAKLSLANCREYNLMALASFIVAYNNHISTKVSALLLNRFGGDAARFINSFSDKDAAGTRIDMAFTLIQRFDERMQKIAYQIDGSTTPYDAAKRLHREIRQEVGVDFFSGSGGLRFESTRLAGLLAEYVPAFFAMKDSSLVRYLNMGEEGVRWALVGHQDPGHMGFGLPDEMYSRETFLYGILDGLMIAGDYPNLILDLPNTAKLDLNGTSSLEKERIVAGDYLKIKGWLK